MKVFGILPCGGLGTRMYPLRYPKELLPIAYEICETDDSIRPKLCIEYSLQAFHEAGVKHCFIVIPPWKPELMRYIDDGSDFDIKVAYLYNSKALGLLDAVFSACSWLSESITCLALPDSQFFPTNACARIIEQLDSKKADLVLGVFPTKTPQFLAPVEIAPDCRVIQVEEKPTNPRFMNSWGVAAWGPAFWKLSQSLRSSLPAGLSITEMFQLAINEKLNVYAIEFKDGAYYDIGVLQSLPLQFKQSP